MRSISLQGRKVLHPMCSVPKRSFQKLVVLVHSFRDTFEGSDNEFYKGYDYCAILQRTGHGYDVTIMPNWRCNGTGEFCCNRARFCSVKELIVGCLRNLSYFTRCSVPGCNF